MTVAPQSSNARPTGPALPAPASRAPRPFADFGVIGISHRNCEIRALGEFTRTAEQRARLAAGLLNFGIREVAVLATCNRFEVFFIHNGRARAEEFVNLIFTLLCGPAARLPIGYYAFDGADAARHLFQVASALDSLVVGERQIIGQLRSAILAAETQGTLGPRLRHLASESFRVARQVRRETGLCQGASVVSLATQQLRNAAESLPRPFPVALIGAGEMTEQAAIALSKRGTVNLLFVNRTAEKAAVLARRFGGASMSLEAFRNAPPAVAAILTSTSAPEPILNITEIARLRAARGNTTDPLTIVDLAVPADVDPAMRSGHGIVLFTIDDLRSEAAERAHRQHAEIEQARDIIEFRAGRLAERELRRADGVAFGGARARAEAAAHAAVARLRVTATDIRARALARAVEASHRVAHSMRRGKNCENLLRAERRRLVGTLAPHLPFCEVAPWTSEALASMATAVESFS